MCYAYFCRVLQPQSSAGAGKELGGGPGPLGQSTCGLSEAQECCGQGDDLSAMWCVEIIKASLGWCGTVEGSGPLRGRPDEAMAPSGSAQFLAAGLEPVPWLLGSVEEKTNKHQDNLPCDILMWSSPSSNLRPVLWAQPFLLSGLTLTTATMDIVSSKSHTPWLSTEATVMFKWKGRKFAA